MSLNEDLRRFRFEGHIDAVEGGRVYGWAWDPEKPDQHLKVAIYHGDRKLGTATANRFREDLASSNKMGDGRHAFVFDLPSSLRQAPAAEFTVYHEGSSQALARAPRVFAVKPVEAGDAKAGATGAVAGEITVADTAGEELLKDPAEILHALQTNTRAINHRLDQMDENYAKLCQVVAALDRKLNNETKVMQARVRHQLEATAPSASSQRAELPADLKDQLKKLSVQIKACWRDLKAVRNDVGAVELFTIRFEEQLKQASDQETIADLKSQAGRQQLIAWLALGVAVLALMAGAYGVFFG